MPSFAKRTERRDDKAVSDNNMIALVAVVIKAAIEERLMERLVRYEDN